MNPFKKSLKKHIDDNLQQAIEFLHEVVNISSYSLDSEGVNKVADVFSARFKELGFSEERVPSTNPSCGKHLLLSRSGTGEKAILMTGHLDTVYSKEDLITDNFSWKEVGELIFGPGVSDMKGGNVMIWLMLKTLQHVAPEFFNSIHWQVHFNASEELLTKDFSTESKKRLHPNTQAILVFEYGPADSREWKVVTNRKGRATFNIYVDGKGAHSGSHPEGASAVHEMSKIVLALEALNDYDRGLTVNVGSFHGGKLFNKVPHLAEISLEVRALDNDTLNEVIDKIQAMAGLGSVQTANKNFTCQIRVELLNSIKAWDKNPNSLALLDTWKKCGEILGLEVDTHLNRGGLSDGNFYASEYPTLDGLGPAGKNLHCSRSDSNLGLEAESLQRYTYAEKCLLNSLSVHELLK